MSDPTARDTAYALVLAGARASGDALATAHGVESKALIDIGGAPMLSRVLRALTQSGRLRAAPYVSGLAPDVLEKTRAGIAVNEALSVSGGPASSLLGAIDGGIQLPLLVTTCDHALLTAEMVDYFVKEAIRSGADLTVGLAAKDTIQASYPETRRTYIPFGGAPMSGCNLFFINSPDALKIIRFWQQAEQDRKKPLKIAWRFGPVTALRLLIGRPAVHRAFELISARLGARAGVVVMPFAEAAIDVDSQADLDLVRSIIAARRQG
ncbi:nucleotidyltransferase family protein [Hyphomonas sp.]|uniref:nucleotidyltransferase family protein n=1 Tax=Hyphomonas sp. TaxID=87 RepID=UPI0025BC16C2|nr:nucleotidyltransferase family protein [Hyphomonas sp.]